MEESPNIINRILQNRILSHTLFWLGSMVFFAVYAKGFGMPILVALIIKGYFLPIQILATYYLVYYQIPKFMYTRRYFRFFISFFLSALIFCTLGHLVDDYGISPWLRGYGNTIHTVWEIISRPLTNIGYNSEDIYLTVFIATGIKFIKQRLEERTELAILEQEKTRIEIDYLKAQVNPRILARALHQLHVLTQQKSDVAPEVVIKLSDMLDYMLYRCNEPKVLVRNEIELLQNYLDLAQLQYGNSLAITFYHQLENPFAKISPLLLLAILEAVLLKQKGTLPVDSRIEIVLKEAASQLNLEIHSNVRTTKHQLNEDVEKQLELLYPDHYQLQEKMQDGRYILNLLISL